jgi:hypothetical protein
MTARSSSVKKWIMAVAAAGGVATGVVTAAGAASSPARAPQSATSAEAQQLDQQVAELTQQERSLQASLRSHHVRAATATEAVPETTVSGAVITEPPRVSGESRSPSATSGPAPGSQEGQLPAHSNPGQSSVPSTTEPKDPPTTTEPSETTTTVTSTTNPSHDGGEDGGVSASNSGTQHDG